MFRNDSVVAICPDPAKAEQALKKFLQAGFDIQKLSVVGNGTQAGVKDNAFRSATTSTGGPVSLRGILLELCFGERRFLTAVKFKRLAG